MSQPVFASGLAAFADRFAGFVVDQWGVLHDGHRPYPWVPPTLAELKRRHKRIVLLSNSGRRAAFNRERLAEMGFRLDDFDAVVTSGEAAWLELGKAQPPFADLGRHCLLLTREGDRTVADGLDLDLVEDVGAADFIFLSGVDDAASTLEDYLPLLARARSRDLPIVCSNPDLVAVSPGGGLHLAPGTLTEHYEREGGRVLYVGKPHLPIYSACLDALAGVPKEKIVAIGDSLQHDIKGANDAGITAAFVRDGIHAGDFPPDREARWPETLEGLCRRHGARVDFVVPRFVW